jgi:hypothetical protein
MIVLSEALALSPGAVPLNTPIFGWESIATAGTITATSEDASFPASNLSNPSTALRWKAAEEGSPLGPPAADQYLTVAIDQVDPVDYLAVAVHNLGTSQNVLSVEGSDGGSPEWFELVEESIQATDDPIIFRFTPQSLSGIRLRIQPGSLPPMVAVLYVGKLLVMERGTHTDHSPINLARTTRVMNGKSETGNFLGRVVLSESRATQFTANRIREVFYRNTLDEFIRSARETPFFFAWKPQELPADVGYCWMTNDPKPARHFDTKTYSMTLDMGGVAI